MGSLTSESDASVQSQGAKRRRGCLFYILRTLTWFGIAVVALLLLGLAYQAIATELDKRAYSPRGQLYTVNGRQMHIICAGQGSPVIVLHAGGAGDSLWWYRVQNQVAEHTRVCAYDRPGMGWSEPVDGPRDAPTIVAELRTLFEQAGVPAPYVMAGHSYGAILARVYAAQYPGEVVGIVLVDSMPLEVEPGQPATEREFNQWMKRFNWLIALNRWMVRTGLMRLIHSRDFQESGYPSDLASELAALQLRDQVVDTNVAEIFGARWALYEASAAAENLGDLPVAVLWAGESGTAQEYLSAIRAEIATYSTNTVTRVIAGADHLSILRDQRYAAQVSAVLLNVIQAAQTGEPLAR